MQRLGVIGLTIGLAVASTPLSFHEAAAVTAEYCASRGEVFSEWPDGYAACCPSGTKAGSKPGQIHWCVGDAPSNYHRVGKCFCPPDNNQCVAVAGGFECRP